jgi:hypothetical protein
VSQALAGLKYGWNFTPTNGKRPLLKGWTTAPRSTEADLRDWTAQGHNIALRTGHASGIVVVDVDEGGNIPQGCPETVTAVTPGNGLHLYYRAPHEPMRNSVGKLAEHVDIRGEGGCAVYPGSTHPDGGQYEWQEGRSPECITLADFPTVLLDRLRPRPQLACPPPNCPAGTDTGTPYGKSALDRECAAVVEASEGCRNDTLNRACFNVGQLVAGGELTDDMANTSLLLAARQCGLPEGEAKRTICSGLDSGKQSPRNAPVTNTNRLPTVLRAGAGKAAAPPTFIQDGIPTSPPEPWGEAAPIGGMAESPPPWTWDAIPASLADFGRAVAETQCIPDSMAGAAVLGVASIALGNKARVAIKPDHRQFGNLFFMVAAGVGAGKSPLVKAVQAPLVEWETERREPWKMEHGRWKSRKARVEAQIRGITKKAERDPNGDGRDMECKIGELEAQIGEEPPKPLLFTSDATSEALGQLMRANGGSIGVLSGEARKVLAIARGRYAEGGDIDLWLSGHAGDFGRVSRSNKPSYEISEACLAAFICTQPDSLADLGKIPAMRESGFLARWLYIAPPPMTKCYPVGSVSRQVAARYAETIRRLLDLRVDRDREGNPAPHCVKLHPTAFDFWRAYHDDTHAEIHGLAETGRVEYLQWLAKLPETVARIALLFRIVGGGDMHAPIVEEVARAAEVAEVLKAHARRAFAMAGDSSEVSQARQVWRWIDRNRAKIASKRSAEELEGIEAVKPSDIYTAGVAGASRSAEAESLLDFLTERGWLQKVRFQRDGAKVQTVYLIHPRENES